MVRYVVPYVESPWNLRSTLKEVSEKSPEISLSDLRAHPVQMTGPLALRPPPDVGEGQDVRETYQRYPMPEMDSISRTTAGENPTGGRGGVTQGISAPRKAEKRISGALEKT